MRQQDRVIQSELFRESWPTLTNKEKIHLLELILKTKPDDIREMLSSKMKEMTYAELRRLASYYRVKNYSRKSKEELLEEIDARRSK
jgi:hypothetical protein